MKRKKNTTSAENKSCKKNAPEKKLLRPDKTGFNPEINIPVCVYGPPEYFRSKAQVNTKPADGPEKPDENNRADESQHPDEPEQTNLRNKEK